MPFFNKKGARAACVVPVLFASGTLDAQWLPANRLIQRAGFYDSEHTNQAFEPNQHDSVALGLACSGRVTGYSTRFVGGGRTVWTWTPHDGTVRLGFVDTIHTNSNGHRQSEIVAMNDDEMVTGYSIRFGNGGGRSAWVWSPGAGVVTVGLMDEEHIRPNGRRLSQPIALSASGRILGFSDRYVGGTGRSAWLRQTDGITARLGYADAAHTHRNGLQFSEPVALNDAGVVIGHSERFAGGNERGFSAWAWTSESGLTRLGFVDQTYTRSDGYQLSLPLALGSTGRAAGYSVAYTGTVFTALWTWSATQGNERIGLFDAEHTRADGYTSGGIFGVSGTDSVAGVSMRYFGQIEHGQSAWIWRPGIGTVRIGLFDGAHTLEGGTQFSEISTINEAGHVTGWSRRNGPTDARSAWVWTPEVGTVRAGLVDQRHTTPAGVQSSTPLLINRAGQVVGYSIRYSGSSDAGRSGWFFDPATGISTPLVFSTDAEGVNANTFPAVLTDRGSVLGGFFGYNPGGVIRHAFVWSAARGFEDVGNLIAGGLAASGWRELFQATAAGDSGFIVCRGVGIGESGWAVGVLTSQPGCPADFDQDGFVTCLDFDAFVAAFEDGHESADFDSDGYVTGVDFDVFVSVFEAGC